MRELARRALESYGYEVVTAANGAAARLACDHVVKPIAILVIDLVLPDTSGRDLAEQLVHGRPSLKILYMSGYTAAVIAKHGLIEPGAAFLEKPFTPEALARKVRLTLDGANSAT